MCCSITLWCWLYLFSVPTVTLLATFFYVSRQMKIIKSIRYNALIVNPRYKCDHSDFNVDACVNHSQFDGGSRSGHIY